MANADTYGGLTVIPDATPVPILNLQVLENVPVLATVHVSCWVAVAPETDVTEIVVTLSRSDPRSSDLKRVPFFVGSAGGGGLALPLTVEWFDGPGLGADTEYALIVECVSAGGASAAFASALHARW